MERRLTTILAADVVGYSRLMGAEEAGTLAALKGHREALFEPKAAQYRGRTVKLMGDGALMEFASVVDAVTFAVEVQAAMAARNEGVAEDRRIVFRIGINIGDIIVEGEDIYGDGVNVAARLEGLADPGGICVERNVHNQVRDKLKLDFEDLGEVEAKNIARPIQVFRVVLDDKAAALVTPVVVAPVRVAPLRRWQIAAALAVCLAVIGGLVWWQPWAPMVEPTSVEKMALPLPDKPSIAVLPFTNMSGDPEQEYFSDGITEDLITDLSRISGLFVIARNSVFTYKGAAVKVRQVARELGVSYVLEGSVRRAGNRVRINAQLIDAQTGGHLWADRYDGDLTDVFGLQDEVTRKIVAALAVKLTADEQERLSQTVEANPEAYDMLLRGLARLRRYTRQTNIEARELFERAIALDPGYARAYGDVALTYALEVGFGWAENPEPALERALEFCLAALALDESVPQVYFALNNTYLWLNRHEDAIAAAQRAIDLDTNFADGYAALAFALNYAGRPVEALAEIRKAMRLNPRYPFLYRWNVGHAFFLMERYDEAITTFESVVAVNPEFPEAHLTLAAAYAQSGRIEDAEWEAEEILTLLPGFTIERDRPRHPYLNPADMERYLHGLRLAGLPEK